MPNTETTKESPALSRYQLAVFAAQRAKQLTEGDKPTCTLSVTKPTTIAIQEIPNGQLHFFYGEDATPRREKAERTRRALRSQSLFKEREEELRKEMTKV